MTKKLLLFDIDGTLLLSGGAGLIAIEKTFEDLFDIPNAYGNTNPHGKTDPLIFQEIADVHLKRELTQEEHISIFDTYINYFRQSLSSFPPTYYLNVGETKKNIFRVLPGVPKLLEHLSNDSQYFLGLQTGNFEEVAWMKIEKANLGNYFSFGGFGSDASNRTELLSTAIQRANGRHGKAFSTKDIYVIGDAAQDIISGNELGVQTIGVATGDLTIEKFKEYKPTHILEHLDNVELFLKTLE